MSPSLRTRTAAAATAASLALVAAVAGVPPAPVGAVAADLLISEYVEGSSNNKALEVENRTGAPVDLEAGGYAVQIAFNGSTTFAQTIPLTGTLAAGDVVVVANTGAATALTDHADVLTSGLSFNGDDAVVLTKGGTTVVDSIGQVGVDPGAAWGSAPTATADATLRRPAASEAADTDPSDAYDPAATFTGLPTDTFLGIGLPGDEEREPPVVELVPIGEVQGAVADTDDGHTHRSPAAPASGNGAGDEVKVRGIVTELSLAGANRGFWLQEPAAGSDGDPLTSDGIFVFHGSSPTVDGHVPAVGDDLTVTGKAAEFFSATQLSGVTEVQVNAEGAALPAPVEADPPADAAEAARWWERREGMQVTIPAGAVTTSGRAVFASSADSEIWLVRGDDPIAQRDGFERRVFRDAHPLDLQPGLFDDGNGQRILIGPQGVKAAADDPSALLPPARTFSTLDAAVSGAVGYSFEKYRVEVAEQPSFTEGPDPALDAPPAAPDRATELSVGNINVENLYDRRDDPTDGCDFPGNAGCPGVSPPFDYVPADDATYLDRLVGLARQIAFDLHLPDVVTVQEAEDQDICSVDQPGGPLDCAAGGDGRPDTLQELAWHLADDGGAVYDAVSDRDGADDRGIHNGFLYRVDRVEPVTATADHPVLGADPSVEYRSPALPYVADVQNPKALNAELPDDVDTSTGTDGDDVYTRAAQVGGFLVHQAEVGVGEPFELYVVNNHFSSGPDGRIGQRTEQAAYAAELATTLSEEVPGAKVMVAGDLNVFPRPDDPVPPSAGGPSDQLGPLYDGGLHNLWDVLVAQEPAAAYSYVFEGQAQTLDQQLVDDALLGHLVEHRVAHVNADWPAEHLGIVGRGVSDHDPSVSRFRFAAPEVPRLDDEEFVARQFADFVGRAPTPAELEVFSDALADGSRTRGRLVDDLRRIAYDPVRAPVIRLYAAALGRTADAAGTEFWASRWRGIGLRRLAAHFVASAEFRTRYGSLDDAGFVDRLYRNVLGRAPSAADAAYWVDRLATDLSRAEVLVHVTESAEHRVGSKPLVDLTEIFHGLLDRAPTAAERDEHLAAMATVDGRVAVIEALTATQEYADRVGA